jgi:hypothetical protein
MRSALVAVAAVWVLGCVWSYEEQSAFATSKGFGFPHLLPLVIDGFAVSMAGVAWAASLDARPAIPARLTTLVAVAASGASNGAWAWLRAERDLATVVLAVAVPVAANLAFEVLLAELRRQVQRRRGLPAPVVLPLPRAVRVVLAPVQTFRAWRSLVLALTALPVAVDNQASGPPAGEQERHESEVAQLGSTGGVATPPSLAAVTAEADDYEMELTERARRLLEQSPVRVGRRRLAELLDVTEHQARQLLDEIDRDVALDESDRDTARNAS